MIAQSLDTRKLGGLVYSLRQGEAFEIDFGLCRLLIIVEQHPTKTGRCRVRLVSPSLLTYYIIRRPELAERIRVAEASK